MWYLILGAGNLLLLVFALIFLLPRSYIKKISKVPLLLIQGLKKQFLPVSIIIGVVAFHLIEVKYIDPIVTNWVGYDYANSIVNIENGIVYWFSQNWSPILLYFFVTIYIVIYPFTLWFSPLYFIIDNKKNAIKSLAYGLLIIYIIALPFYLFLPITNVYTFYNADSALETAIPEIEKFFYSTTTQNNCLPSLHTAMTILVAYSLSLTGNKKLKYFGYFVMISVIISVIYLSIHWITDVITGCIIAIVTIFLLRRYILKAEKHE